MPTTPYDEQIDINTDWGGDSSTGGRPVAGGRVQEFIKGAIKELDGRTKLATKNKAGLMSSADKTKLDGITDNAGGDLSGKFPNPTIKENVGLKGDPTAKTQDKDDDSTKIATTGFVKEVLKESPALGGDPTAKTQDKDDDSTKIATTGFVKENIRELGLNEAEYSYGVYHEDAVSDPGCIRIGNMDMHKTLPIHSKMRGCLLDDDGNVVKYLDENDWTYELRDGSDGQVMVEIPAHYRKFDYTNDRLEVRLSEKALLGYHFVPKMYVSAYEASLDRANGKLASVVNDSAEFRGGDNQSDWDDTYRSLLGRPVTKISITEFRNYARNRKEGSAQWNCYTYEAHKAIYWLFVVEYATLNSQAEYTPEFTAEGYRQGGLGEGVTNLNQIDFSLFNSRYPFIPCGYTDILGNGTGVIEYEMPEEYNEDGFTTYVPRYRGIENPFGHTIKFTDGIIIDKTQVLTCKKPELFTHSSKDGYTNVGIATVANGQYIKKIIGGEEGDIIAKTIGGDSNSYFCDNCYIAAFSVLRAVAFGGSASSGAYAGFVYARADNVASYANAAYGSRLCFHP